MCNPLAVTAALAITQYVGSQADAEKQYEAQEKSALAGYDQIQEKQRQINDASAVEQTERIRQGLMQRATISTVAGESNALGFTSDRLAGDSFFQQGTDISSMEKNRQNSIAQTVNEAKEIQLKGSAANATTAGNTKTLLETGLQIGDGYYKDQQTAKNRAKAQTGIS